MYDAKNCVPDKDISFHHVPYVEDENEGGGQLVSSEAYMTQRLLHLTSQFQN